MDFDQQLGELQRRVAQCQEGVGRRKLIIDSLAVRVGAKHFGSRMWGWIPSS